MFEAFGWNAPTETEQNASFLDMDLNTPAREPTLFCELERLKKKFSAMQQIEDVDWKWWKFNGYEEATSERSGR